MYILFLYQNITECDKFFASVLLPLTVGIKLGSYLYLSIDWNKNLYFWTHYR